MKIRAAVLYEIGLPRPYTESQPLKIEELELDGPGTGEVLVRVAGAGLCHSDLSVINGDRPRPTPMALGHEAAGVVEEVGPEVHDLEPGDHVVMVFVPSCGHCRYCAEGRPALCEPAAAANTRGSLLSGAHRLHRNGETILHHLGVSCFAERAVLSQRSLVKIDPSIPLEHAALFGCAVLTGVGAAINTAQVKPGTSVAVIGLGGVGLNAVMGSKIAGAARIIGIDMLEDKFALAEELGATDTFNAADTKVAEEVRDATGGGVDYAIEVAGSEKALELAYRITRRGGVTVTAGLAHPSRHISLQQAGLVGEERTLKGSYVGSCVPRRDLPRYLDLFMRGVMPVNKVLSNTVRLDELNEAFDRLADGHVVRQVLQP